MNLPRFKSTLSSSDTNPFTLAKKQKVVDTTNADSERVSDGENQSDDEMHSLPPDEERDWLVDLPDEEYLEHSENVQDSTDIVESLESDIDTGNPLLQTDRNDNILEEEVEVNEPVEKPVSDTINLGLNADVINSIGDEVSARLGITRDQNLVTEIANQVYDRIQNKDNIIAKGQSSWKETETEFICLNCIKHASNSEFPTT